jgi:uncharacterized 2Fe-2S/4Fe-4S cluster protein (DUF4445 family)
MGTYAAAAAQGRLAGAVLPAVVQIPHETTLQRQALAKAIDERIKEYEPLSSSMMSWGSACYIDKSDVQVTQLSPKSDYASMNKTTRLEHKGRINFLHTLYPWLSFTY